MKILLICTHNACRSIIGEAVFNKLGNPRIEARSAGSSPRGIVHPLTLKHLTRHDYDTSTLESQSWDDFSDWKPDVVITLCDQAAGETCPIYFGDSLKIHWGLPDPSKDTTNEFENFDSIISILEKRIAKLLDEKFEDMDNNDLKLLFNRVI
jgi:arsenate reductase (thioredoxin)|tara:strand:+ start:21358 stop:21813 length:456 start_codon:yes stop_codon:yes gene_type:complete